MRSTLDHSNPVHVLVLTMMALLAVATGCATAGTRSELVRNRAELDFGCPAQQIRVRELEDAYLDEQLWGGSYEAEGCGTTAEYQLEHCGLGAAANGCSAIAKTGPGAGQPVLGDDF